MLYIISVVMIYRLLQLRRSRPVLVGSLAAAEYRAGSAGAAAIAFPSFILADDRLPSIFTISSQNLNGEWVVEDKADFID
jgi:hypothetical protein